MYICKYMGGKKFKIAGSEEMIDVELSLYNDIINYSLIPGKSYLLLNINKEFVVMPYRINKTTEDNLDITINNTIVLKKTGDIEITLQPLRKLKINNKNVLTTGAVINAPNGPCTILQDGQ